MDVRDLPGISPVFNFPDLSAFAASGIYFLIDGDEVVYVGQASDMQRRIGTHLGDLSKTFTSVRCLPCAPSQLNAMERRFIEAYKPKLNNCSLSKFMRNCSIEPQPVHVEVKRRTRSRIKYKIAS